MSLFSNIFWKLLAIEYLKILQPTLRKVLCVNVVSGCVYNHTPHLAGKTHWNAIPGCISSYMLSGTWVSWCLTTRASLLHLMDELTELAHGCQSQRCGNSCTRETCWALPRFVMSSISTHKSNVGEKDRQTDRPTIFLCEIPQSYAFPFTPQARFAFSSV